jgi:hypothetical protein
MANDPPREAGCFLAGQEIPRLLWGSNVHYRFNKSLPLYSVTSHFNPGHTLTRYLNQKYLSSIGYLNGILHSGSPTKTVYACAYTNTPCVLQAYPSNFTFLDLTVLVGLIMISLLLAILSILHLLHPQNFFDALN